MESKNQINEYYNFLKTEIHNSKMGSIKSVLLELFRIINNPSCSARELKEVVELDPPLTLSILKLSNSAYYGTSRKITDIQEAIVWLGFDTVKHLALSMKVLEMFDDHQNESNFTRLGLWTSSIASALMGKAIYRRVFRDPGNFIYSAGLLHNIGIIFLDQFRHPDLEKNVEFMRVSKHDLFVCEKEFLDFDHANLAADIMEEWDFPYDIVNTIRYHHNPIIAPKEYRQAASCIFLIDQMLNKISIGFSDLCSFNEFKFESIMKYLRLDYLTLQPIIEHVLEEVNRMQESGII